jgi:hypothetical protein
MTHENINLIIHCPNCNDPVIIEQLNCKIFRHGVFKNDNIQINPHASQIECENYVSNGLIYGCGKPFKIIESYNSFDVEVCDYI